MAMAQLTLALVSSAVMVVTGAKAAPSNAALETLRALDSDGSGEVEEAEVLAFAKSRNLADTSQVLDEFHSFDWDHSGGLDAMELGSMLGVAAEEVAGNKMAAAQATPAPSPAAALPLPEALAAPASRVGDAYLLQAPHQTPAPAPEAAQPEAATSAATWLQRSAREAEVMASRAAAEMFAKSASGALAQRAKEEQALKFEKLAHSLREKERDLSAKVGNEIRLAAEHAVQAAMKDTLAALQRAEGEAVRAEEAASARRAAAQTARHRAEQAQADLSASMQNLRGAF